MSILGPLGPFFGFTVMCSLGFKARVGCLIHIVEANVIVHSLRSTSGTTPANLLTADMAIGPVHTCCCQQR